MINQKIIYKIIGQLLYLEAVMMVLCMGLAFYYKEDDTLAFLVSIITTLAAAFLLKYKGRDADNLLGRRDAYLVVTLTWVAFSVFGSLPYLVSGYIINPTDAFFETMSGFTTTGATILDDVEVLPHGMMFWRSLTQFIGGLGIVFFTIAVLPSMVGGSVKIFSAEATGPISAKLHPRLSTTAKWIWTIYIGLTIACAVSYWLCGMGLFDSINHSMSTTATGGFSTYNDNFSHFHSSRLEYTCILFEFLSGINFTMLYLALFKGRFKSLFHSSELRLYVTLVVACTLCIMAVLILNNGYNLSMAFRNALFQVVSFVTSTGLFNDNVGQWPRLTWIIIFMLMVTGACSGSTACGIKCVRVSMMLKMVRNEFRRMLHPKAVLPVKMNNQSIPYSSQVTLLAFLAIFTLTALVATAVFISVGVDVTNAVMLSLGCISNVGPSLDNIGPLYTWNMLPDWVTWFCSMLMLMGRLEIFSVLVLFTPAFWNDN